MPQLNDEQLASFEALSGITPGQLNDVLVAYLKVQAGIDSNNPNDLWYQVLTDLGYTGQVNDMQVEYWEDITGTTGAWNDLYLQWLIDTGGAFGPNVNIVLASGGSCGFQPPTTTDCTAVGTYTANDSGFTNPADTWLWTIEPPVVGVDLTDATLKTCTVTTPTADANLDFNLKVVATDSVSTDTANRTTAFTQAHTDTNVAPAYIGPNIAQQFVAQNAELGPIETFTLYTGTNLVFTLEGTWPANAIIGASTGTISGTIVDPVADYPNLTIRATNSQGFADSFPFTVTVLADEVAPVFDAGPVPDQIWEVGVVITQFPMSQFFSGTLPIVYTIESGALPAGLTMNDAGQINGTPTTDTPLTGSLVVRATNGAGFDLTNDWGWTSWEFIFASGPGNQVFPLNELYTHDYSVYFAGTVTSYQLGGVWPAGFAIDGAGVVTGTATVLQTWPNLTIIADNPYQAPVPTPTFDAEVIDVVLPAFYALTPDETTFEMLGVSIGTGGLITTHTADLYAPDVDGLYRVFYEDKPVWANGRYILNKLSVSEDFTQTGSGRWSIGSDLTITPLGNGETQIDSGSDATDTNRRVYQDLSGQGIPTGADYISAMKIRTASGTATGRLVITRGGSDTELASYSYTATTTPQKITINATLTNTGLRYVIFLDMDQSVIVSECQTEDATTYVDQTIPSEYAPSIGFTSSGATVDKGIAVFANLNGNTVLSNVVTEAVGAALPEVPYLQYYPAATNSHIWSNDLTQAGAWFPTTMTAALDQVGVTGEPSTATLLTATGANSLMIGTAVAAASATQATAWWLKRSVGTGVIEITLDNAVTWQAVVLTADYQKFTLDQVALTNPTIGIRIVTSGDAVIVGNAELHTAETIEEVRGLGPIFTTTAAVATDRTLISYDYANHDGANAAWYVDYVPSSITVANDGPLLITSQSSTSLNILGRGFSDDLLTYDGGQSSLNGAFTTLDINYRTAVLYVTGDNKAVNADGTWSTPNAFSGAYGDNGTLTSFNSGSVSLTAAKIRELQRYDITTFAEGESIINDLMAQTITMTAGNAGQDVGYRTATFGTLVPDTAFGFTINEIVERFNDVTVIVDGIQGQTIFDTMEIDGVVLDFALADTFGTGGGVSTWTFDATALTLVSANVYPVVVKTA